MTGVGNTTKPKKRDPPQVGDRVFAGARGFPAWPARVESAEGNNRYRVLCYGTHETATLKAEDIWPYNEENKKMFALFGKIDVPRQGFAEGMNEIENDPDVKSIKPLDAEGGGTAVTPLKVKEEVPDTAAVPIEEMPKSDEAKKTKNGKRPETTAITSESAIGAHGQKREANAPVGTPPPAKQAVPTTSRSGLVTRQKKSRGELFGAYLACVLEDVPRNKLLEVEIAILKTVASFIPDKKAAASK